jgi:cyclophilin family peptidyl-prolyl cis-trans isomerase
MFAFPFSRPRSLVFGLGFGFLSVFGLVSPSQGQGLLQEFPNVTVAPGGTVINVTPHLPLDDLEPVWAAVDTPLGQFVMRMFPEDAPVTVENFWEYVEAGRYNNTLVHRLDPHFVLQTGGFTATLPTSLIPTFPPIVNEFGRSNTRGTVAMAKLGGDPDSATSQWFVNLADNSSNLDNQNGGFTVFAEVVGTGMTVIDNLAKIPTHDLNPEADNPEDEPEGPFGLVPLLNYFSGDLQPSNLVAINRVARSVFGAESSNPRAIEVEVVGSNLILTSGPQGAQGADIRVFGVDEDGNEIEGTFRATGPARLLYSALAQTTEGPVFVNMAVNSRNGMMTGTMTAPFGTYRFRGFVDFGGNDLLIIDFRDTRTIEIFLNLITEQLNFVIYPPLPSTDFAIFPLQSVASTGSRNDASPLERRQINTVLLPLAGAGERLNAPGFFTTRFDRRGFARMVGMLPDGTRLNGGFFTLGTGDPGVNDLPIGIFRAGRFPLQIAAYFSVGVEAPLDAAALVGELNYQTVENPRRTVEPEAIDLTMEALGTFWEFERGVNMLAPGEDLWGFKLSFDPSASVLPAEEIGFGPWPANNRPSFLERPRNNRLAVQNPGTFRGAFSYDFPLGNQRAERPLPFQGILLSTEFDPGDGSSLRGAGFQLTPEGSVGVFLEATEPIF